MFVTEMLKILYSGKENKMPENGRENYTIKQNIKLSMEQAVKAHRVMRRRGSHIFSR
jgi:hypothetical protein